jgi:uncharacterized protein YdeI (YjbR/CyaY-like superfamily)
MQDREHVEPGSRAQWRAWLDANHATSPGAWVVFARRHAAGADAPGYEELVLEALCYGWVDSRPGTVDAGRTRLYFAPRRPGSAWAATNKARVTRLVDAGIMAPAGLAAVERAKSDGSWSRIDGSEDAVEPPDLLAALDAIAGARATWDAFPRGARRAILQWIELARRPATRAARVAETATKAARGERANEWSPKDRGRS